MQRRRWVAVVAVLIIALLSFSFLALKAGSGHPAVRREVLARVLPEVGADVTIGELEVGLASLTFGDVDLDLGSRGGVHIPFGTVSLSYRRLLLTGLDVRRSLSTAIVSDPVVTLRYGAADTSVREAGGLLELGPYLPQYMGISGATVVLEDVRSGKSVELSELDLLLTRRDDGSVTGSAAADALGGTGNLTADIEWDTRAGTLSVDSELSGARATDSLPLPPESPVEIHEGSLYATGSLKLREDASPEVLLSFALDDGRLALAPAGEEIARVRASGALDGTTLSLTLAEAVWRGGRLSGRGTLDLRTRGLADVVIEGRGMQAGAIAELAGISREDLAVSGGVDAAVSLGGTWSAPTLEGSVRSDRLLLGEDVLQDLSMNLDWSDERLDVSDLEFDAYGGSASAALVVAGVGTDSWETRGEADVEGIDAGILGGRLGAPELEGRLSAEDVEFRISPESRSAESLLRWSGRRIGGVAVGSGAGGAQLSGG
ncbi:MAG: hypothetical protein GF400_07515, partial [Candidatus Eisenbacteria bacterium]|nr:hypothetical protein [Candidatus Eisenbacteria bacterium]